MNWPPRSILVEANVRKGILTCVTYRTEARGKGAKIKRNSCRIKIYSKNNTMQELLDEFDVLECFEQPGHGLRVSEMTKRQIALYKDMGITPPPSLC
jgi:hypothetical protein